MNEEKPIPEAEYLIKILKEYDRIVYGEPEKDENFYQYNKQRIVNVLNSFIESPARVNRYKKIFFYIYENDNILLKKSRKNIYKKELKLIRNELKEKGYKCHIGTTTKYETAYKTKEVVSIHIDFNKKTCKTWSKLIRKLKK